MPLQLSKVSVATSTTTLLNEVDAILVEGERVGLTGGNGSGKSTLLKILADCRNRGKGSDYWTVTSGKIHGSLSPVERSPGTALLVDQDVLSWSNLLLPQRSYDEQDNDDDTEEELRQLSIPDAIDMAIAQGGDDLNNDSSVCDDAEAWRRIMIAAGTDLCWDYANYNETPIAQLSPGAAFRAYMAIALHRQEIQLLLLDEPTNFLDLPSILWLQHAILASQKTIMMVSHDEEFLNAIANRIWEIDAMQQTITVSVSNYSDYLQAKRLAVEQQKKAYEEQQKRHKRLTVAADKLKQDAVAGAHYQSKDHDLLKRDFKRERAARSGKRASAVTKLRDSEEKVERVQERHALHIQLEPIAAGTDASIVLDSVQLGYTASASSNGKEVRLPIPLLSCRFDYGERVAIVGYNSIGKSTLLRIICKEMEPVEGTVTVGRELRIGNLMQEHESLPRDTSPRDYIATLTGLKPFDAASRAIKYGLTRYQVDQPIRELNPGARARLLLATFSIRNVNVLILDEPTSHLDQEASTELTASLNTYEGTIIVVSHDRHFLEGLKLTFTLSFSPQGLRYLESVSDYVEQLDEVARLVVHKTMVQH